MKKSSKVVLVIFLVLIIVGTGTSYFVFLKKPKQPNFSYTTVERQTIKQVVSVTGKIKPAQTVDLSFEKAGKVSQVFIKVGEKVGVGQTLITLDASELKAQLAQYQAQLEADEADLAELRRGTRQEEIDLAQTAVENAEKELADSQIDLKNEREKADTDLANLYDDVKDLLQDAYATADDAVTKQTNEMFEQDSTDHPQLIFSTSNNQNKVDAEWQRVLSRDALKNLKAEIDALTSNPSDLDRSLINAENHLVVVRDFLNKTNEALNNAINISQTTVNTYKGYVNTGRSNVNTKITSLNNQKQSIAAQKALNQQNIATAQAEVNTAQNTLSTAQGELILKKAGTTQEEIQAQEAQVKKTQANIQNIQAQIAKTTLHSPIGGVVVKQEAKTGEIVAANAAIVSVISETDFEIEANVPEVDISKIKLADPATLSLDAYGEAIVFEAMVSKIDPAETIVEGVTTYKVTLQFKEKDERIKSGMTADIDILTNQKENVIAIPYRAVIPSNGAKTVRVLKDNGLIEEVAVETGIRGSDGNIEIVSGLQEGDRVITFLEQK